MSKLPSKTGLILVLLIALLLGALPRDHSSDEPIIREHLSKLYVERSLARIPTRTAAQSYEYCQLGDESTVVDRALAGEEVDSEVLTVGDVDRLRALDFSDIEYVKEPRPKRYTIAVVGVGYSDDDALETDIAVVADRIESLFGDFQLNVLYSLQEVPFTLVSVGGFPNLPPGE